MNFSELSCCPFCGFDEFYEKQYARGPVVFFQRYDGKETDNSTMHESLVYSGSNRVYCASCQRYIGNTEKDSLSKNAEKAAKR